MATQIHGRPLKNSAEDNKFEEEESVLIEESAQLKRKRLNLEQKEGKDSDGGEVLVVKGQQQCCQVEKCGVDLSGGGAKKYHKRHKVCPVHAKAPIVLVAGLRQRFCQQCSRFHELSEFDGTKRSCRRRLAGHNERRRKTPPDIKVEDIQGRQINGEAKPQMDSLSSRNTSSKNYHFI